MLRIQHNWLSFTLDQAVDGKLYHNYEFMPADTLCTTDEKGISVFYKNEEGEVFHTYSCYMRGIDIANGAYQFLDMVPKGRDEDALEYPMQWLRIHDRY